MSTQTASTEPSRITVVESEACHFCDDARRALSDLATRYPLTVATVDVRTGPGLRLMHVHRASMSPLVLVDGEFFSQGRLPRRKLVELLEQRHNLSGARG